MLDRQLNAILTILNDISDGAFKIIDADDIIGKLSESDKCTKVELAGLIRTLSDNDYIKVKYSTVDEYCLSTLAKARAVERPVEHAEEEQLRTEGGYSGVVENKKSKDVRLDSISLRKMVRRAAFYGALLGGMIAGVIGLLIGIFIKIK